MPGTDFAYGPICYAMLSTDAHCPFHKTASSISRNGTRWLGRAVRIVGMLLPRCAVLVVDILLPRCAVLVVDILLPQNTECGYSGTR
eukprot:1278720-Rhodomonas_salina.1